MDDSAFHTRHRILCLTEKLQDSLCIEKYGTLALLTLGVTSFGLRLRQVIHSTLILTVYVTLTLISVLFIYVLCCGCLFSIELFSILLRPGLITNLLLFLSNFFQLVTEEI